MKPEFPPPIIDPCPLSWDGMKGDGKRRFCKHCQLHVHNLSHMTSRERRALLSSTSHVCVTYAVDEGGALSTRARGRWLAGFFSRIRTAAVARVATILPLAASHANRLVMGACSDERRRIPDTRPRPYRATPAP